MPYDAIQKIMNAAKLSINNSKKKFFFKNCTMGIDDKI